MKPCVKCGSTDFAASGGCKQCKREYDKAYRKQKAAQISATKKKCFEAKKDQYLATKKVYYENNKAEIAAKSAVYRAENRDYILAKKAEYRDKNREKLREDQKAFYEANKTRRLAEAKAYVERNKDKVKDRRKDYHRRNSEKACARAQAWYKTNIDRVKLRAAAYYKANPEVFHNSRVKRRSLVKGQSLSAGLVDLLLKEQGCRCAGCSSELTEFHLDHVMPLSLGGAHEDNNIQLLCAKCNLTKHAKHPLKWFEELEAANI